MRFVEETVHQGHSTLDFVVSSAHDDYELAVRIIHCPEWRQSLASSPVDGAASDDAEAAVDVDAALADGDVEANLTVLKVVQDWHLEYQDGPLVVVDRWA